MILKLNRKSKGKTGVVEYLLNERTEDGTAIVLRGNAELTKSLIKSNERKHKYLSGGLMFAKEEYINNEQKKEIMDAFEKVLFAGISSEKYNILWVEHSDKERIELNFVVPRMTLDTGIDLDLYSHSRDLPLMDMWKNGINVKYKLQNPNDPRRSRTMTERMKVTCSDGHIVANRKNLDKTLHALVENGQIKSRNQMIELLMKSGYQITRKNEESLSVKHEDIGKKALRLKGGIYSETFRSTGGIESLSKERERRIREYDNKVARGEIRTTGNTYQKYLQSRIDRHTKRYASDKQISQKKDKYTMVENNSDENNKGVDNERIRELIKTNRQRRKESFERTKRRETELFKRIRDLNHKIYTELRTAEQRIYTCIDESRRDLEKNITDNARRINEENKYSSRRSRSFAGRVYELFRGVDEQVNGISKSIKNLIIEVKKMKLFNQASEDMLSKKRRLFRKI